MLRHVNKTTNSGGMTMKNSLVVFALLIGLLTHGTAFAVSATVIVPGNATGGFGNPALGYVPLVPALDVSRKGTIKIIYKSGTVNSGGILGGPNGISWSVHNLQSPLQEAIGTMSGTIPNLLALIGAFVPASTVENTGFAAVDGTKALATIGIPPTALFFVGKYSTVEVNGPGTLFLGINDCDVHDNVGSFTVYVTGP
jgi:hypothetical protein